MGHSAILHLSESSKDLLNQKRFDPTMMRSFEIITCTYSGISGSGDKFYDVHIVVQDIVDLFYIGFTIGGEFALDMHKIAEQ